MLHCRVTKFPSHLCKEQIYSTKSACQFASFCVLNFWKNIGKSCKLSKRKLFRVNSANSNQTLGATRLYKYWCRYGCWIWPKVIPRMNCLKQLLFEKPQRKSIRICEHWHLVRLQSMQCAMEFLSSAALRSTCCEWGYECWIKRTEQGPLNNSKAEQRIQTAPSA